jgi:peptidyl-prolyl cis-trans isomerase SurA
MSFNKSIHTRLAMAMAFFAVILSALPLKAQESADKIIVVIGRNRIILKSELEAQVTELKAQNPNFTDSMKCSLLENMILQKLLLEQAERDSVMVSDDDVDGQLDNRIRYFQQLYGGKDKLEQASGKTVYQLKEENRDAIRDQLIAEKMQGQVLQNVKITPAEVEAFYRRVPVDSLPFYPASVEVGQIVIDPPVSPEIDAYAREKLQNIRKEIVEGGKSFEVEAGIYSDDGSRDNGGDLGTISRADVVPEFAAAAFKLQDGEVSQVVKTKFGYHIIQMVKRQGDQAHVRHILIRPELTSADFKKALDKLDSVRSLLIAGKFTFPEAVGKYSTDESAKRTGGMIADPATGATTIEINKLDPGMVIMLDSMQTGQYSQPQIFITDTREKSCRVVYLKTRTAPHKANLTDDYAKIQDVALQQKKSQKMMQWVAEKLPSYYLKVDPEYQGCKGIKKWLEGTRVTNGQVIGMH